MKKKKKILLGCAVIIFSPFLIVTVMAWAIVLFPSFFNDTRVSPEELAKEHKGHKVNVIFTDTEYPDSCLDYLLICQTCEEVEVKYLGYKPTRYTRFYYDENILFLFHKESTEGTDIMRLDPPYVYDKFKRKYEVSVNKDKEFNRYN